MLKEHKAIVAALKKLVVAAKKEKRNDVVHFAEKLMLHAKTEEEVLYPEMPLLGVAVLGICLGAQLIASDLGARVYRNPFKEIGWFQIQPVPASESVFSFPSECIVFHWHGETFDLPGGAVRLAMSAGCEIQAFQLRNNVIG